MGCERSGRGAMLGWAYLPGELPIVHAAARVEGYGGLWWAAVGRAYLPGELPIVHAAARIEEHRPREVGERLSAWIIHLAG